MLALLVPGELIDWTRLIHRVNRQVAYSFFVMSNPSLLFIATTDSYLKWVDGLRHEMRGVLPTEIFLAKTLQNPTQRQKRVAVGELASNKIQSRHVLSLLWYIQKVKPNVIFVGATGPFLVLLRWLLSFSPTGRKTKLVSGSPGVAYHLIGQPLRARSVADLILVASRREWSRLGKDLEQLGSSSQLALATLPFLEGIADLDKFDGDQCLVFAPQPDMPKSKEDRIRLLLELGKLADNNPELKIQIKLRAIGKEPQTHFEQYPYQELEKELVREGRLNPGSFSFVLGSISEHLKNRNAALMTVSSTAALESIAMGNPTHIISDFGASDEIATSVFSDSGLVWPIAEHSLARMQKPSKKWLDENYFHNAGLDDWRLAVVSLANKVVHHRFELLPTRLSKSLFVGEFLRVMFPNQIGKFLISSLKLLSGKN